MSVSILKFSWLNLMTDVIEMNYCDEAKQCDERMLRQKKTNS
jgi:hypothetical protein